MSGQHPVEQLCMEQLEQQYGGVVARAMLCKEAADSSWVRGHLRSGKSVKGYQRGAHPEQEPINVKHKTTSALPEIKPGQSRVFELCVQDHRARKAGRHFDLRLGDPRTQIGYSWAIPKARLPEPGEKLLAVRQPDHQLAYFDFRGILCVPSGTLVSTADGPLPVERLVPGRHEVLGIGSRGLAFYPLKRLYEGAPLSIWVEVRVQESAGQLRTLLCGSKHQLYVSGKGFVEAEQLTEGDTVLLQDLSGASLHERVALSAQEKKESWVVRPADEEGHDVMHGETGVLLPAHPAAFPIPLAHQLSRQLPSQSAEGPAAVEHPPTDRSATSKAVNAVPFECFADCFNVHREAVGNLLESQSLSVIEGGEQSAVAQLRRAGYLLLQGPLVPPASKVPFHQGADSLPVVREGANSSGNGGLADAIDVANLLESPALLNVVQDIFGEDAARSSGVRTPFAHSRPPKVKYAKVHSVARKQFSAARYDLEVADAHNYFAAGVLTHNSDGYGAGTVALRLRGRSTITESSPSLVRFSVTEKQQTSEYVLRRTGSTAWLLQNVTAVKQAKVYVLPRERAEEHKQDPLTRREETPGLLLGLLDLMRFRPLVIKNMSKDRREDVQQIIADQRKRLSGFTEEQRRQIMLWQLAQTSPEARAVLGLSTVPADERKKKLASAVSLRDALLQEATPTAPLGQMLSESSPLTEKQLAVTKRLQLLREVARQNRSLRRRPPELDAAGRKAAMGDDSDPDNPQDALLPPTQGSPAAIAATRGEGIKEQGE